MISKLTAIFMVLLVLQYTLAIKLNQDDGDDESGLNFFNNDDQDATDDQVEETTQTQESDQDDDDDEESTEDQNLDEDEIDDELEDDEESETQEQAEDLEEQEESSEEEAQDQTDDQVDESSDDDDSEDVESLEQFYDINQEEELEKPTDIYTDFKEYVNSYGFVWEEHEVVTKDNYILREFRIPGAIEGFNDDENADIDTDQVEYSEFRKPVVVLMHGLMSSMETWFQIQNLSIPFQLAIRGYDVWILNGRGNQYGRANTYLDPDYDRAFWNFSFDKKGLFDVNDAIDYILEFTQERSVSFMSHSQGTSDMFFAASFSEELELNIAQKVNFFVAFGPIVLLDHVDDTLKEISDHWVPLTELAYQLNFYEIPPCSYQNQDVCLDLEDVDTKFDVTQEEIDEINDYLSEWIDSTFIYNNETDYIDYNDVYLESGVSGSLFELLHYSQIIQSSEFKAFDYVNLTEVPSVPDSISSFQTEMYGQDTPPLANITNIEVPTALVLAKNDTLSTLEDAKYILDNMQSRYVLHYDEIEGGHETFLVGKDRSFMEEIYDLIKFYSSSEERQQDTLEFIISEAEQNTYQNSKQTTTKI